MRTWVAALTICSLPSLAQASPPNSVAALSWTRGVGAESCPDVREIAALVDQHLGREAIVSSAAAELFIEGQIAPAAPGPGWRVYIRLTTVDASATGVRDISSAAPNCADIADSAALAIGLMIDPTSGDRRSVATFDESSPVAPTAQPSAAPTPIEPEITTAAAPPQTTTAMRTEAVTLTYWRSRISLNALGVLGQLPGAAFGVSGGVALSPMERQVGLELSGMFLPIQREEVRQEAGGDFSASAFGLSGWWSPYRANRLSITLFAGGQVGEIEADGFGFDHSYSADSLLANLTAQGELGWQLAARWEVLLRLGLGIPLQKDSFETVGPDGEIVIFQPAAVTGSLSIGVGVLP